ncbi:MAG: glutamyl-tRNA reductase [Planctomycetes bacterium]|nr:glutamyl-tRNA reductase [Planctomycetota bacterium]
MRIVLVGCNHRSAPLSVRERVAFDGPKVLRALDALAERFPETEVVVLSTCNRVELYAASEQPAQAPDLEAAADFLAGFHGVAVADLVPHLYFQADRDAVRHLFAVAGSLDSLVPGESQILAQVKEAYRVAKDHGMTGPVTNALFQKAISVGKQVHTSTQIARRKVSVPSVAVEFACEIFEADHFPQKTVLVIGAGEMGELTLEHLCELRPGRILVTNRTAAKAAEVAARWNGQAVPFEQLDDWLIEADLVLSTTGSPEPLVGRERFDAVMSRRGNRPVFIIDIAVPRDFAPEVGELENVYLYNIDDLQRERDKNLKARERELLKAQSLIDRELTEFWTELTHQRHSGPVISQLRREWDARREAELARLFALRPDLSPEDREAVARTLERFQNQLLHQPLSALRSAAENGHPHGLLDALKRLFHIGS